MANTYTNLIKFSNPAPSDVNWQDEWWRNTTISDVLLGSIKSQNRIISGGELSIPGAPLGYVECASGIAFHNGEVINWQGIMIPGIQDSLGYENSFNWVYLNEAGQVTLTLDPPTGIFSILGIAEVNESGAITRIADYRVLFQSESKIPGLQKTLLSSSDISSVFVYNTAYDSDGGDWIETAVVQAWFGENLNTDIRGRTRPFPAVVLIVAELNKITFFDATSSDCAMWMVFNSGAGKLLSGGLISSVSMINGILVVGEVGALIIIDFITELTKYYATDKGIFNGDISKRDEIKNFSSTGASPHLIETTVNSIDTVIIDAAPTGPNKLPVPTIAVATNGGISIIDGPGGVGTIIDLAASDGNNICQKVWLSKTEIGFYNLQHVSVGSNLIPAVSPTLTYLFQFFRQRYYGTNDVPSPQCLGFPHLTKHNFIAGVSGLTLLRENPSDVLNGMVAYIAKDYNTGWLKGSVRRAVICEAIGTTDTLSGTITDRSVRATTFVVTGSLIRTPVSVGAELQQLNGFSTANFISQAYNAELDFVTADFYFCGWLNVLASGTVQTIFDRSYFNGTINVGPGIVGQVRGDGGLIFYLSTDGFATYDILSSNALNLFGNYSMYCFNRRGSVVELWFDGILDNQVTLSAATGSLSNAQAALRYGLSQANGAAYINGYMCLQRIGAGSLSGKQIEEMYNTEKELFKPGAKCTLQGSVNTVIALAIGNKGKNSVFVEQEDAVNEFLNLRCVDSYNTVGTGRKIHAAGGMLLEASWSYARVTIPEIDSRKELQTKDKVIKKLSLPVVPVVSTGAGQTSLVLDEGFYPEQVFDAGVLKAFTVSFDGFMYSANFSSSTGDITIFSRRI